MATRRPPPGRGTARPRRSRRQAGRRTRCRPSPGRPRRACAGPPAAVLRPPVVLPVPPGLPAAADWMRPAPSRAAFRAPAGRPSKARPDPAAKAIAEARAACSGRARACSVMPSSSRACAPSASCALNASATARARGSDRPRARCKATSSSNSPTGSSASSRRSRCRSAASASARELTETYSPAAIEKAPATKAAIPAVSRAGNPPPAAAMPSSRLAVEIRPSLAPSTAARNQPARPTRCHSWCCFLTAGVPRVPCAAGCRPGAGSDA